MKRLALATATAAVVVLGGCYPPLLPGFGTEGRGPVGDGQGHSLHLPSVPTTVPPLAPTLPPVVEPAVGDSALLACIRFWEQGEDGYATDTGNGYFGAYQFDLSTGTGAVERAGHGEYAGSTADTWPPEVQDAAAAQLLEERGLAPWPTPAIECQDHAIERAQTSLERAGERA